MISRSPWVPYEVISSARFESNLKNRLFAASIEEERPYLLYVATKGLGPRAISMTVSLEFLERHDEDRQMGGLAINLCLKNSEGQTAFKSRSFLESDGFWAPESDVDLSLASPNANFALVRGYFTDVQATGLDIIETDVALGIIPEYETTPVVA